MNDPPAGMEARITFRPVAQDDRDFLLALYGSTRREELDAWGWEPAREESFLARQFLAQRQHHQLQFAGADDQIVLLADRPVGRIMIARTDDEITLVDIALLPEAQSRGIGTSLIEALTAEVRETGMPLRLHVVESSRAVGLYERLGFSTVGQDGLHRRMEWNADSRRG